jgi:hypothetical protein
MWMCERPIKRFPHIVYTDAVPAGEYEMPSYFICCLPTGLQQFQDVVTDFVRYVASSGDIRFILPDIPDGAIKVKKATYFFGRRKLQ